MNELLRKSHRLTGKAASLIGQSALEDLVDPGGSRCRVAVIVLGVQCAVGKAAISLFLLPLLLKQIGDGVEQVVQELVSILLHVVIEQLCGANTTTHSGDATSLAGTATSPGIQAPVSTDRSPCVAA